MLTVVNRMWAKIVMVSVVFVQSLCNLIVVEIPGKGYRQLFVKIIFESVDVTLLIVSSLRLRQSLLTFLEFHDVQLEILCLRVHDFLPLLLVLLLFSHVEKRFVERGGVALDMASVGGLVILVEIDIAFCIHLLLLRV